MGKCGQHQCRPEHGPILQLEKGSTFWGLYRNKKVLLEKDHGRLCWILKNGDRTDAVFTCDLEFVSIKHAVKKGG